MEEAVSVEGISEDCTVYEGYLTEENLGTIAEAVLTAAKDDQELKSLFDSWTEAGAIFRGFIQSDADRDRLSAG